MFGGIAEDAVLFLREAEEDGETETDIEVAHPVVLGLSRGEDMVHAIGGEIVKGLRRDVIEDIIGARTDIEQTEIGESGKAHAAVCPVTGSYPVGIG